MADLESRASQDAPRHARRGGSGPAGMIVSVVAGAIACVLVGAAATAAVVWNTYSKAFAASTVTISETDAPPPDIGALEGGFNIMLFGSDTREGQGGLGDGGGDAGERNDVNILLHVAADQQSAVAVSFPRDMRIPMPDCATYWGYTASFNVALNEGFGCAVDEVSNFTGLRIDFAAKITFVGVVNMTQVIGGVDVCTVGPVYEDDNAREPFIPGAGTWNLQGYDALRFLRTRYGVGDGSDWGRISSQQVYLSSLVRKIKSDHVLEDVTKLFPVAQNALSNLQVSNSLSSPWIIVQIAKVFANMPLNRITFVQYPSHSSDGGVVPSAAGEQLMDMIRNDQPFQLDGVGRPGAAEVDPNAGLTPEEEQQIADNSGLPTLEGVQGQTAADYTCSVPNS